MTLEAPSTATARPTLLAVRSSAGSARRRADCSRRCGGADRRPRDPRRRRPLRGDASAVSRCHSSPARPARRVRATTDGRISIRAPLTRVPDAELTRRERDVLELLSESLTTRTIADRLEISSITVRRHVGAIVKKLKVSSREEAVRVVTEAAG